MPLGPKDPMTELVGAAISCHEMYSAFQAAGFTKKEALYLVAQTLKSEPQDLGNSEEPS